MPNFKSTIEDLTKEAQADNRVTIVVAMPDGGWGVTTMAPELWAEKDEIVGPDLVRLLKIGYEELLRDDHLRALELLPTG